MATPLVFAHPAQAVARGTFPLLIVRTTSPFWSYDYARKTRGVLPLLIARYRALDVNEDILREN